MGTVEIKNVRMTQYAAGGGCACKIPPGELEEMVAALAGRPAAGIRGELIVGLDDGDDAAVVVLGSVGPVGSVEDGAGGTGTRGGAGTARALVLTTDFFTPVVDDPYDWGRIAAANALSDVYAVGGEPVVAVNLLGWPRDRVPFELAAEVLRGGLDVARSAGCHVAGGHSIDDPEPKYGMAVTGIADPARLLRLGAGLPGLPLSLSKPLGSGVLNNRHKTTGEVFPQAIDTMTKLNADASRSALSAGVRCGTDVTGFGLLGHLYKLARASRVSAVIDTAAVPYLEGARAAVRAGFVSGGTRRNLSWVSPHLDRGTASEEECLLLADAQTSGGLLLAGEVPGAPVIGRLVPRGDHAIRLA